MRHGCTKKSAAVTHPKPVDEGAEDREEEAATDDSVVEQQEEHEIASASLARTGEPSDRGEPSVKSVGGTPVQCVDHPVPLSSGTFSFSVLGVGAGWGSSSLECVCFDHLSRTKWSVTRSG